MDFGATLGASEVFDVRRRGEATEAYEQYAAGRSDRRQRSRKHLDGESGGIKRLTRKGLSYNKQQAIIKK
jgi:hypothetical protein